MIDKYIQYDEARKKQIRLRFGSEYLKVCENVVGNNNAVYEVLCRSDWNSKNELDRWVYICIESDDPSEVGKTYCNAEPCYPKEPVKLVEYQDETFVPTEPQPTVVNRKDGKRMMDTLDNESFIFGNTKKVLKHKWVKIYG